MPSFRDFGIDESVIDIFNSLNPPLKTSNSNIFTKLTDYYKEI